VHKPRPQLARAKRAVGRQGGQYWADVLEIERLLHEVASHLETGTKIERRTATYKLERIIALASTLALTIQCRR
jgi:hypothetical protein